MPAIDAHGQGVYPSTQGPSTSKFSVDRSEAAVHLLRYRDSSAEYPVIIEVLEAHPVTSAVALVGNGYPAGVAVIWAMHHGSPYPVNPDSFHTSAGGAATRRRLRPISYPTALRRIGGNLVVLASLAGIPQAAS
jgi:hypothetical protein